MNVMNAIIESVEELATERMKRWHTGFSATRCYLVCGASVDTLVPQKKLITYGSPTSPSQKNVGILQKPINISETPTALLRPKRREKGLKCITHFPSPCIDCIDDSISFRIF